MPCGDKYSQISTVALSATAEFSYVRSGLVRSRRGTCFDMIIGNVLYFRTILASRAGVITPCENFVL